MNVVILSDSQMRHLDDSLGVREELERESENLKSFLAKVAYMKNLQTAYSEIKAKNPNFKAISHTYPFNAYATFRLELREYQKGRKKILLQIEEGESIQNYEFGLKEFEFILKILTKSCE